MYVSVLFNKKKAAPESISQLCDLPPSPARAEVAGRARGKDTPCDVSFLLDGFYSRGQWRRVGHIFIVLRNLTTQNDVAVLIHLCRETVMMTPGALSSRWLYD